MTEGPESALMREQSVRVEPAEPHRTRHKMRLDRVLEPGTAYSLAAGNMKVKVLPAPSWLRTQMRP